MDFEVLFHRATFSDERWTGAGTLGGRSSALRVGLYLGRRVVLIDGRRWWFSRRDCEQSAPEL